MAFLVHTAFKASMNAYLYRYKRMRTYILTHSVNWPRLRMRPMHPGFASGSGYLSYVAALSLLHVTLYARHYITLHQITLHCDALYYVVLH